MLINILKEKTGTDFSFQAMISEGNYSPHLCPGIACGLSLRVLSWKLQG